MTCPKCKKRISLPAKNKAEWVRFIKADQGWACPKCGYIDTPKGWERESIRQALPEFVHRAIIPHYRKKRMEVKP